MDWVAVSNFAGELRVSVTDAAEVLASHGVRVVDIRHAPSLGPAGLALLVMLIPRVRPEKLRVEGAAGDALRALHAAGLNPFVRLVE